MTPTHRTVLGGAAASLLAPDNEHPCIHVDTHCRFMLMCYRVSVMKTQSGMLPDCVSTHLTRPMMYTSERVQGVQRYLNSAHIKTQPGVVATSKLVPFEIQQTLRRRDEPVYIIRHACRAQAFSQINS